MHGLIFRVGIACAMIGSAAEAQHEGDVFVGRSSDGQLKVAGFADEEFYVPLMPVSGLLNGWTDNEPGFDRVITDDPENDLLALQPGAQIWLQVVDIDPAFRVIDAAFAIVDSPGEQTFLGGNNLHTHLTWHINSNDPQFDSSLCVWEATFVLRDLGATSYITSAPFTFAFTNVARAEADGDWDSDEDVDLTDHTALLDCFGGPTVRPTPQDVTECEVDCLSAFDFDGDDDIDLSDIVEFTIRFGD